MTVVNVSHVRQEMYIDQRNYIGRLYVMELQNLLQNNMYNKLCTLLTSDCSSDLTASNKNAYFIPSQEKLEKKL